MNTSKEQTAFHEAGHAVVSTILGKKFKYVTIKNKGDALGHVHYWRSRKKLYEIVQGYSNTYYKPETIEKKVKKELSIAYGGYLAELQYGIDNKVGATEDFEFITNIALSHFGQGAADAELEKIIIETRKIIHKSWSAIQIVANELLINEKLTGKAVWNLFNEVVDRKVNAMSCNGPVK
jgi:ATP-dependent Zn protease